MMEFFAALGDNLGIICGGLAIGLGLADTLAVAAIGSMENIRNAWRSAFPKVDRIDWREDK